MAAEAVHFARIKGGPVPTPEDEPATNTSKRQHENGDAEEDPEAKRRRILEETRDIDADSEEDDEDDSSEDDSDDEDETAELQRELEKIKRERAEKREQEVRTNFLLRFSIANGPAGTREGRRRRGCSRTRYCSWQPIAQSKSRLQRQTPVCVSNSVKGLWLINDRWDDDVIFKNQARGTDDKRKKEFVNVSLYDLLNLPNLMITAY